MKKTLAALTCGIMFATTAMADIARVEMGAGAWMQTPKGKITYTQGGANGVYTSNENKSTEGYIWALIKHPIPVLPNIRLEYVSLEDDGKVIGKFKNFDTLGTSTAMTYDMKQYDIIPYYNILDNTPWVTLDLGLDFKIIDAKYNVAAVGPFTGYSGTDSIVIPLLYVRTRVEIPTTDIGLEADVKYVTTGDSTVYDVRAKVDYTLDFVPVIQPAVEFGYRVQKIDINEKDADSTIDMEYSGVYLGLMLRF